MTEDAALEAVRAFDIDTITALREHTEAGDGCMACHSRLRQFLDTHAQRREIALIAESA